MYSQDCNIDFRSTDTHMQGTVHAARGRSTSRVASDSSAEPTPRKVRRRNEFARLGYRVRRAAASNSPPEEPSPALRGETDGRRARWRTRMENYFTFSQCDTIYRVLDSVLDANRINRTKYDISYR